MGTKRTRLTLELALDVHEQLQAAAARKGVSLGEYCRAAIYEALVKDELNGEQLPRMTIEDVIARRKQIYGDQVLPGSSVDLIREAREERDRQIESW